MFSTSSELAQKSLQIKENDKFFSRLLSKETTMANPSFRVYYGGVTVTVPFMWESQPGTPKYSFPENTLPPLTPPPSYYSNSNKKPIKKHSRSNLLHFLFSRIKKTNNASTFPSSSSSSSSSVLSPTPSSSASWSSLNYTNERSRFSSRGSSFDSGAFDEETVAVEFPASILCFGANNNRATSGGRLKGCYAWW